MPKLKGDLMLLLACAIACAAVVSARGQSLAEKELPGIVRRLASRDYAIREAAQSELERFTVPDLDLLRMTELKEADPEVKARLKAKITSLEVYAALHPKPLSVDLKNATTEELEAVINGQLAGHPVAIQDGTASRPWITLKAENLPLWEILDKIDETRALTLPTAQPENVAYVVQILSTTPAKAERLQVFDGIALTHRLQGASFTGEWELYCVVHSDPRVRFTSRAGELRIDRFVGENGRVVVPQPKAPLEMRGAGLSSIFSLRSRFGPGEGMRDFRELHGAVVGEIAVETQVHTVDLTAKWDTPIETAAGTLLVKKDADGNFAVSLGANTAAVDGTPVAKKQIQLKTFTEGRRLPVEFISTVAPFNGTLLANRNRNVAASLQVTVVSKAHPVAIPVVIRNTPPEAKPAPGTP